MAEREDWECPGKKTGTELRNTLGNRSVYMRGLEQDAG